MKLVCVGLVVGAVLAGQQHAGSPGDGPPLNHAVGYYDARLARVVLVGGPEPPQAGGVDRAWSWTGERWEPIEGAGPSARGNAAAAYDAARAVAVVLGGARRLSDGARYETLDDTWERRDEAWAPAAGTTPGPRDHHALAYDAARETVVMFGGMTGARGAAWPTDTWTRGREGWTRAGTDGPPGRARAGLAYDAARRQLVLFGGIGRGPRGQQPFFNDTWVWDGASWLQAAGEGPPARYAHGMVFDAARGVALIYGGHDANGPLADMWQWDGARWSEIVLSGPTPGPRYQPVMVYDVARGVTVLFGTLTAVDRATWEWDGTRWTRR